MSEAIRPGHQLATTAKSILSPLGCKRIGCSRTRIADQRFWIILIEFQPSSFSRGSHLNVGASWLWSAKDHWSFDHGTRVEEFAPFQDEHQFAAGAERLAMRAAEEVRRLRKKFRTVSEIAREIAPKPDASTWPIYHAAIAAGLAGDTVTAKRFLTRVIEEPGTAAWQRKLQAESAELARNLADPIKLRVAVVAIIQQARALHRLPPDPGCLDAA